ncbi:MAG: hypothetical protein A2W91_00100 [Bacteroidetes bacterium GWF2_38_335]|nr:MAG: hypothetical protein A2W91_00100 [Bacteroidetes bacterium GWF2_38_335]OFY79722.1 MAG: hypothetical protein A2281_09695 [Bacteroidetes bacterium RIFOXYA12_FULL_38_20]HBS87572.1 lytic transglycosylase [Bacteroidales bacterium]
MGKKSLLLFLSTFQALLLCAADNNTDSVKTIPPADPISSVIDSLDNFNFFVTEEITDVYSVYDFPADSVPAYSDLVYEYRMKKLDNITPIQLDYNSVVQNYIELYTVRKRYLASKMIGLAKLYFPIFEEKLDKYDLPLELKYLAIVESALNPMAKSKSGATGLWQFMLNSGKMLDLKIDSYVDERRDPYKSTEAACRYLEYLYKTFNDWQLALAAYNGGPGMVRNAIERSGGKSTFWEIRPFLPAETQNYVPAFIAVVYVMNHTAEHNIKPIKPRFTYFDTDTVQISQSTYFSQITKFVSVDTETLKFLNPSYKANYIPVYDKPEILVLPADKVKEFIAKENDILSYVMPKDDFGTHLANAGEKSGKVKVIHTVEKGEYFHKIALKYGCSIDNLKAWNNQTENDVHTGQQLEVWLDPASIYRYNISKKDVSYTPASEKNAFFYYVIQQGDSLESIAGKFKCESADQLRALNSIVDDNEVVPGKKIKISGAQN